MPKKSPAKPKAPAVSKAKNKTNAPSDTGIPTSLAEKFLEATANDPAGKAIVPEGITAAILSEVTVPTRQPNDPFPASVFPSEEAMFQSLGVRPDLTKGTLKTQPTIQGTELLFVPETPENQSIAPLSTKEQKTEADEQGTNTGRTRDEASSETGDESDVSKAVTTQFPTGDQANSTATKKNDGSDENTVTTQSAELDRTEIVGGIATAGAVSTAENLDKSIESELSSRVTRLPGEGRSGCHERLRRLARASGLPRGQGPGTAYNWALEQTDRLFAELAEPVIAEPEPEPESILPTVGKMDEPPPESAVAVVSAPPADDGSVTGLSDLPPDWGELPANAQLQVEIAWVTANRLRVRDGTGVNLAKALSPAPSYSALSWLETSILFPAKFADISVKATASQDDEREFIKREKLAIDEIRSILAEMMEAEGG